ncbi:aldehyde dehydrogenase family-domain-containing protein, partial [Phascolomyces articulosus]
CAISKLKDVDDVDDVVAQTNDTTYGLAPTSHISNITSAITIPNALKAGSVWVNCYNVVAENSPFDGYNQSGFGRESGDYFSQNYTRDKDIKINNTVTVLNYFYKSRYF